MSLYADVRQLSAEECQPIVDAIDQGQAGPEMGTARWLLAHLDDAVIWGRRGDGAAFALSSDAFPGRTRARWGRVQQLRIFDKDSETLIWRTGSGLTGRVLSDAKTDADTWLLPRDENLVLIGDRADEIRDGFTLVSDATGSNHAVPLEVGAATFLDGDDPISPLRLSVRHHFERDAMSGAVRVAATRLRLVWVATEGNQQ